VKRAATFKAPSTNIVVGIDGATSGWVAVRLVDGVLDGCGLASDLAEIVSANEDAEIFAIDIPIGLPDRGQRAADRAAREFVGPRRSSVFAVPPRAVLSRGDYAEANALSRQLTGKGIPRQSFALRERIFEAEAIASDPRVHEVHPEASFRALKGSPLDYYKKTWNGLTERIGLLADAGIQLPGDLPCGIVLADDVVDAAVAAWSAQRISRGEGSTLPAADAAGPAERTGIIWY